MRRSGRPPRGHGLLDRRADLRPAASCCSLNTAARQGPGQAHEMPHMGGLALEERGKRAPFVHACTDDRGWGRRGFSQAIPQAASDAHRPSSPETTPSCHCCRPAMSTLDRQADFQMPPKTSSSSPLFHPIAHQSRRRRSLGALRSQHLLGRGLARQIDNDAGILAPALEHRLALLPP